MSWRILAASIYHEMSTVYEKHNKSIRKNIIRVERAANWKRRNVWRQFMNRIGKKRLARTSRRRIRFVEQWPFWCWNVLLKSRSISVNLKILTYMTLIRSIVLYMAQKRENRKTEEVRIKIVRHRWKKSSETTNILTHEPENGEYGPMRSFKTCSENRARETAKKRLDRTRLEKKRSKYDKSSDWRGLKKDQKADRALDGKMAWRANRTEVAEDMREMEASSLYAKWS